MEITSVLLLLCLVRGTLGTCACSQALDDFEFKIIKLLNMKLSQHNDLMYQMKRENRAERVSIATKLQNLGDDMARLTKTDHAHNNNINLLDLHITARGVNADSQVAPIGQKTPANCIKEKAGTFQNATKPKINTEQTKDGRTNQTNVERGRRTPRKVTKAATHATALPMRPTMVLSTLTSNACPRDTFMSRGKVCVPCPAHSYTLGVGSTKERCICYRGFQGPPGGPCTDINECVSNEGRGPCHHTCNNILGSYVCSCTAGYRLDRDRHSCLDINECLPNGGKGPCDDICGNSIGSYVCGCSTPGYQLGRDRHSCEDINECLSRGGKGPCNTTCNNTMGSYVCGCSTGFQLDTDGHSCTDINECLSHGGKGPCNATCDNTMGSYVCGCSTGFQLDTDGHSCADVNECLMNRGRGPCNDTCVNVPGSYVCSCSPGYILDVDNHTCTPDGADCSEVYKRGERRTGVYWIKPTSSPQPFKVRCELSQGGWTVLMRRFDGSVDFYRTWAEYKQGFGSPAAEHWLGNDQIHQLTNQKNYTLRVEFTYWSTNTTYYADYQHFRVAAETQGYRLSVSGFSGNATWDSLEYHDYARFSTRDRDNDAYSRNHCAQSLKGAWWYYQCSLSQLTGRYQSCRDRTCMTWYDTNTGHTPLRAATMKVKPA